MSTPEEEGTIEKKDDDIHVIAEEGAHDENKEKPNEKKHVGSSVQMKQKERNFHNSASFRHENAVVLRAALFPVDPLWDKSWRPFPGESTIRKRINCLNPDVLFYATWFDPFSQRTWIALEESKVKYKWREINPYKVDASEKGGYTKQPLPLHEKKAKYPEFVKASLRGLTPAIRDHRNGDVCVRESLIIAEYVNRVYGNASLIPKNPYEMALVQIWCEHCTDRIQNNFYSALMLSELTSMEDIKCRDMHIKECFKECRVLARAMSQDGPFFLGNKFSLFEVAFAPFYQRIAHGVGEHYLNLKFPEEPEFQRLETWWRATVARPSVAATLVSKDRLIASYSQYAKNMAKSDYSTHVRR